MCGHRSENDHVNDFCDSKHASSHILWGKIPQALQIFLYFDELELCDPLAASRKKHKIGNITITVIAILPKCIISKVYFV